MPIHEKYRKDEKGEVEKDENGDPIMDVEGINYGKFPDHFLADSKEGAVELYNKYLITLKFLADKYSIITGLSLDDFVQEGVIGLARAKRDFEEARSNNFNTFAIYKIKDAMREFVTSQGGNTRIPQYIKDTLSLINRLKKVISSIEAIEVYSLLDVWEISKKHKDNEEIGMIITQTRESLYNLASRSCTTVEQLIERAELMPLTDVEITDYNTTNNNLSDKTEEQVLDKLITREYIEEVKEIISPSDYGLLVAHFAEGKTVRELSKELGIEAPSVTVKIHKIVEKLNGLKGRGARNYANGENIKNFKN